MNTVHHTIRTLVLRAAPVALLVGCIGPEDLPANDPSQAVTAPAPVNVQAMSFDDRLRVAELVFQGSVRAVSYAISDPAEVGGDSVPHTFVTFDVERTFKGRADGASLTLRFVGGRTANGGYMMSSSAPLFDIGERAILFVRGNGSARVPLVGWRQGRMRVVDGRVYSDDGREVQTSGNALRFGPQRALDEVFVHAVAGTTEVLDARRHADLRPAITGSEDRAVVGSAAPAPTPVPVLAAATSAAFATWLDAAVARTHTAAALAALPTVRGVSPTARFVGPSYRPVAAPVDPLGGVTPPLASR